MNIYINGMELPPKDTVKMLVLFSDGTVIDNTDGQNQWQAIEVPPHGRLVVLPCKVGDILFEVDLPEYGVIACEVLEVLCINKHEAGRKAAPVVECVAVTVEVIEGHGAGSCYSFDLQDFGKTVFLTREEAKAALRKDGTT